MAIVIQTISILRNGLETAIAGLVMVAMGDFGDDSGWHI